MAMKYTLAELLPHAAPMILIDDWTAADETSLEAAVSIRTDSPFCDGQVVGAWVGVEYMAQAVAAWAGYRAKESGQAVRIGFLLGTRHFACSKPVFPVGCCLHIRAELEFEDEAGLSAFVCTMSCDGEQIAKAGLTVFQPKDIAGFLQKE